MTPAARGALLVLVAVLASLAGAAYAQHPVMQPRARALHARLLGADVVAIATVERVEPGRLVLGAARVLSGHVPEEFEVKRPESAPPPLAVGDRALLLLRGARPPFVLVDKPEETIRLADAASEQRWAGAVSDWLAVRERPRAWVSLYLAWIDEGPDTLRELAAASLLDPAAPFQPLDGAVFEGLGRGAWDADRSVEARRQDALLASLSPQGIEQLALGFLAAPPPADPQLAETTVRAAPPPKSSVDGVAVLLHALEHPDAEVRRTALQMVKVRRIADARLRARIEQLTRDDPESWLRAEAQKALDAISS